MRSAALFKLHESRLDVAGRLNAQFLKWIGNKQRVACEIISHFPERFETYYEPFLGSGAVLGTLAPRRAVASDALEPLIGIWKALSACPSRLIEGYRERWESWCKNPRGAYEAVRKRFNEGPNEADLLFLARSCYGGVVRFRLDGLMSTPMGVHRPIHPKSLEKRMAIWQARTAGTNFLRSDFEPSMAQAGQGDMVYCDPPYSDSQRILYGAQSFSLERLFVAIRRAKQRGARIALSLDGQKKSGTHVCRLDIPTDLFPRVILVNCGRSMLRRFQLKGSSLESEVVADRLLLTWE